MGKIRRGKVNANGASLDNVVNISWREESEFDRRRVDEEMAGMPVQMTKGGSGTVEVLSGNIATGYGTADWTVTYHEVTVEAGVESSVEKTVTFKDVTVNSGGSIDNDAGPGNRSLEIQFGEVLDA